MLRTLILALALCALAPAGTSQACDDTLPGLRVWWDADDVKWQPFHTKYPYSLDIPDRIGGPPLQLDHPYPNSWEWTPQFAPGIVGQAYSFDLAHPQYYGLVMTAADHPQLDFTTAMSIEMWIRPGTLLQRDTFALISKGQYTVTGFQLYGYPSSGRLVWRVGHGGSASAVEGSTSVLDGTWHHVVATFDGQQLELYVDGMLDGASSASGPIQPNNEGVILGRNTSQYESPFQGLIDEVSLYGRALEPTEILEAYQAPARTRPSFPSRPFHSEILFPAFSGNSETDIALDGDVMALPVYDGRPDLCDVYRRTSGGAWVLEQRLTFNYGGGASRVALSGNLLAVGVNWRVNIYRYDGAAWNAQYLSPGDFEYLASLSAHGDTVVAGKLGRPIYHESDEARIYRYDGATWALDTTLSQPFTTGFGRSVALGPDLLAVGAPGMDLVGNNGGAVFFYRRIAGTWTQVAVVTPDMLEPGLASYNAIGLGSHVHVDGERAVLGAAGGEGSAPPQGAAYVVDLSSGSVVVEGSLKPSTSNNTFADGIPQGKGRSVYLDGDLAVVAAAALDSDGLIQDNGDGDGYVFARRGGVWTEIAKPRSGYGYNEDRFFNAVALQDGTVYAAHDSGQVYVYEGFEAALNSARPISNAGPDQVVPEGDDDVTLDGTDSFDCDGNPLTYSWTQVPGGTLVTLSDPFSATPTFDAPYITAASETLTFLLVVDDGELESDPDHVDITVTNSNSVPVAEAGGDLVAAEGSSVDLDGVDSYDVDNQSLTFAWTQVGVPTVVLSGADTVEATFTAPSVGPAGVVLTFELVVSDGLAASAPDRVLVNVTNVNNPPVASAGAPQTQDEGNTVYLDGSDSDDPDDDALEFLWSQTDLDPPFVSLSNPLSPTPNFVAPDVVGVVDLDFTLTVRDGNGGYAIASTTVTVRDGNAVPSCSQAAASIPLLWPPNHKMVEVGIVGVHDLDDETIEITILGVRQDEPTNGLGDGDTGPADAVIQGDKVLLRAERSGLGNGRVYHIHFRAEDDSGAQCTGTVQVGVPHDKNPKKPIVDDGPVHNSLGGA